MFYLHYEPTDEEGTRVQNGPIYSYPKCVVSVLRAGRLRGRGSSPGRVKNFHFSMSSRPALGSTQPPIQWVPGARSRG
jgi:hypothetical protein